MVTVEALSHDGRGIARIDGKTVFIAGALPGEKVDIRYYKRHKNFDEAICETVLDASPERMEPRCSHFSLCGGCSLQHLSPQAQHLHKQSVLIEQLKHFAKTQPDVVLPPLFDESSWGYRYKARLSVRYSEKKGSVFVGFREKTHPRFIAQIEQCHVLLSSVGLCIKALHELIESLDAKRDIPQIEIAAGDEICALIIRHMSSLSNADREKLLAFGKKYHFWMISQPGGQDSLKSLDETLPLESTLFYRLPEEDLTFYFHPAHFTQINPRMNQKLVQRALELLKPEPDEIILDLYCGLGNFSLPLAKRAKHVIGVEGSNTMVQQAQYNAKMNNINNVYFSTADLSDIAFRDMPWAKGKYDKILLDPARAGALEIVQSIEAGSKTWHPKSIVYVSCNPATLARDAGILVQEKGYRLREAGIADMFPHTSHVESIALFERAST